MMDILIQTLEMPNVFIRQTCLIFFREMIGYSEVKQVLHSYIHLIVQMTQDGDIECRTHARQLCKESLQEKVFSIEELKEQINYLSGSHRDFLMTLLYEEMDGVEDERPVQQQPPEEQTTEDGVLAEKLVESHINGSSLIDRLALTDDGLLFSSSYLSSLTPLQEGLYQSLHHSLEPSLCDSSSSLYQSLSDLRSFDTVLQLVHSSESLSLYYEYERKNAIQSLHTVAQWIQDVMSVIGF